MAAGFDLGVRSADFVSSDAIAIPLGKMRRMAVAASPAFFENRALPQVPQDLHSYPCVRGRLPDGTLLRWRFEKDGEELQLDVEGPITLDESSLARIAVTNGVGIGYFMEADIREDIAAGRLIRILEDWTPPLVPLCLYYYNRRNSSAAFQAFIALARDVAAGRLAQP
ncbi:DNA-binding transcriptional LysR family regulator [Neorhizobium galegae]|nr:DNA-binding transcriptional LysR family regulator [Neorhizobium galegae]